MIRSVVQTYLRRGWVPTPLVSHSKKPLLDDWPTRRVTEDDIPRLWTNGHGVGLVLGTTGLVDVDLDCDIAVTLARRFLPTTGMISGHDGRPCSHWWYRCGDAKYEKFADLVELRAGKHQTVVAPSIHPEGHTYRWYDLQGNPIEEPGDPAEVSRCELRQAVARLAVATLLAQHWPRGQRHEAALALAGTLRRAGWSLDEARNFVAAVAKGAEDPEISDRLRAVQDTYDRSDNDRLTGLKRLSQLVGRDVTNRLVEWLDLPVPADGSASNSRTTPLVPIPEYQPFPLDVLPEPWREFCRVGAEMLNVDPAMTALPVLAVLGSAIGMTRQIRLGWDWFEPAVLWTCVVGDSGTRKSGAAELSVQLVMEVQQERYQQFKFEEQAYQDELRRRKLEKSKEPEPDPPVLRRVVVSDTTLEKVIAILDDNPRGLLLYRDELRGWFGSFHKYRQANAGSDEPSWLSMHGAKSLVYDRKTGTKTTVIVPYAAVSVTGTIQLKILRSVLTEQNFGSGLVARVLFAAPPKRIKRYVEAGIPDDLRQQCVESLAKLYELTAEKTDNGNDRPRTVCLSEEARARWKQFVDDFGKRQYLACGDEAAAMSKAEGLAGRFALIHHLVTAGPFNDTLPVKLESIEAGIQLAEWGLDENLRLYRLIQEDRESAKLRELVELVQRLANRSGGTVSPRDLVTYHKTKFPTPQAAESALATLVSAEIGEWVELERTGQRGRSPGRRFRFATATASTASFDSDDEGDCEGATASFLMAKSNLTPTTV
jgi:hypothetical protein